MSDVIQFHRRRNPNDLLAEMITMAAMLRHQIEVLQQQHEELCDFIKMCRAAIDDQDEVER